MDKKLIIMLLTVVGVVIASAFYLSLPREGFPGTKIIADHQQLTDA